MKVRTHALILGVLVCDVLAAYSVFGVPVPRFSVLLTSAVFVLLYPRLRFDGNLVGTLVPLGFLAVYSLVLTLVSWQSQYTMPSLANPSYATFIIIRYVSILEYVLALIVFYHFARSAGVRALQRLIVIVGIGVSIYAIYVYVAQHVGLWEIPRTRMGTGGQDFTQDAVSFSYAFHRALGSFQEPSHLAQWLIVPIVLSLGRPTRMFLWGRIIMVTTLILTGSLLGFAAIVTAWAVLSALRTSHTSGEKNASRTKSVAFLLVAIVFILDYAFDLEYSVTILERLKLAVELGVEGTNRAVIAQYASFASPGAWGFGLGNASLRLTDWIGGDIISSHLSLYLHYYFASGLMGLLLLIWFLLIPIYKFVRVRKTLDENDATLLLACHFAWIVIFATHAENLTLIHAAVLASLLVVLRNNRQLSRRMTQISTLAGRNLHTNSGR